MNQKTMGKSFLFFTFIFLVLACFSIKASASTRVVAGISSSTLKKILRDDFHNYVYAADDSYLYIIDTVSERVIKKISITGPVLDMAANKSFTLLDIAAAGMVTRIDLIHHKVISQYSLPNNQAIDSVAFDSQNNVYVWAYPTSQGYPQWGWIYKLDPTATKILVKFGIGVSLNEQIYQGLVRTNATGSTLYVGQLGESPLTISSFDISGTSPVFLASNPFNTLGSNLEDFVISPDSNQIYVAAGAPYGFQIVNSNTLTLIQLLKTQPYPSAVALSMSGDSLYGVEDYPGSGELYAYDQSGLTLETNTYPLASSINDALDIAIDRHGKKAFVIEGSRIGSGPSTIQVVDVDSEICHQ